MDRLAMGPVEPSPRRKGFEDSDSRSPLGTRHNASAKSEKPSAKKSVLNVRYKGRVPSSHWSKRKSGGYGADGQKGNVVSSVRGAANGDGISFPTSPIYKNGSMRSDLITMGLDLSLTATGLV